SSGLHLSRPSGETDRDPPLIVPQLSAEGDESSPYGRVVAVTDLPSFFLCDQTYFANEGPSASFFSSSAPPPSQLRDNGASG
ncbi:hypothetical protein U1Q18_032834, partial [Sarracenia purpurea var. burkii]